MSIISFPTTVAGLNTIVDGTSAIALDSISAYNTAVGAGEIVQFTGGLSGVASTVGGETAVVAMSPTVAETGAVSLSAVGTVGSLSALQVFGACAAAFGVGFVGGVGIAEIVDQLDPDFWFNFYDGLNKKFGKVKAVFKEGVSYLPLDVLEWVRQYFQDNHVFDISGATYDKIDANTTATINSLINPEDFDEQCLSFVLKSNQPRIKNWINNGIIPTPTGIVEWCNRTLGSNIDPITDNDGVTFYYTERGTNSLCWVEVGIIRDLYGKSISTIGTEGINPPSVPTYGESTGAYRQKFSQPLKCEYIEVHGYFNSLPTSQDSSYRVKNNCSTFEDIDGMSFNMWNVGEFIPGTPGIEIIPDEEQPEPQPLPQPEIYPNWSPIQIPTIAPEIYPLPETPYYPIKIPAPDVQPNQKEAQDGALDDDAVKEPTEDAVSDGVDDGLNNPEPKPPITPTPPLPIIPPSTSPIGLHALYVPNATQLQEFNDYLWGNDFFDNVKKIFQDPMEGIISLHKVYFSPTIKGNTSIVIGKQNTGVNSDYTEKQYYEIDCGTVKIEEFFKDVRDYKGYTSIQLYLPFIGIEEVNVNDLMNKNVNITYKIDILTANCIAIISAETFSGVNQILYIFNGNCGETVPISGSNYTSIMMSSLAVVGAVIGTVATDGLLAPTLLSSGASLGKQLGHTVDTKGGYGGNPSQGVQRSGTLGGNFGALAPKKPYIIINRSVAYDAYNYQDLYGFPANKTIKLGLCNGYTRVKSVHVEGIVCTDEERDMIEQQLMEGVIV